MALILESGTASLSWPAAPDNSGAVTYTVLLDGEQVYLGSETSTGLDGLVEAHVYAVEVSAADGAGNADSLEGTFEIPDVTAPVWPEGAELDASGYQVLYDSPATSIEALLQRDQEHGVALRWPAAADAVEVAAYEVFEGETSIGQVDNATLTFDHVASRRAAEYAVVATDLAGNVGARLAVTWERFVVPSGLGAGDVGILTGDVFGGGDIGDFGLIGQMDILQGGSLSDFAADDDAETEEQLVPEGQPQLRGEGLVPVPRAIDPNNPRLQQFRDRPQAQPEHPSGPPQ